MSYFFQSSAFDFPNKSRNTQIGYWKELGRTTLGSASQTIDVSSLADKRYLMILSSDLENTAIYPEGRLNNDTGTNYASKRSANGGAFSDLTGRNLLWEGGAASTTTNFSVGYFSNFSTKEKLGFRYTVFQNTAGAGNAPAREENVSKWVNTSDAINRYTEVAGGGQTYNTGSEVVILGWDSTDTAATNFWTELASVNASGSSTNLSSGTITAKKYLWVQAWLKNTSSHTSDMTFNNDTTTYAWRYSDNGGADGTTTSDSNIELYPASTTPIFVNMFIINISDKEKLVTGHTIQQSTAGAGTAPNRREFVGKYDSTSAQITEIDIDSSSGNWDSTSIIKVWGSD